MKFEQILHSPNSTQSFSERAVSLSPDIPIARNIRSSFECYPSHEALPGPSEEATPLPEKRKRGAAWQPWEDRALARQVQSDDPILGQIGRKEDRWAEVSRSLAQCGMSRSWSSCKDRMEKLVLWHKEAETQSKQKTGTNEEVTDHIECLDDIVLRYESLSKNTDIKKSAKERMAKKREDGKKLRQSSLEGLVRKKALERLKEGNNTECVSDGSDHSIHIPNRQKRPKHHLAKEVAGAVDSMHEKAAELREKIEEREKQERENAKVQKKLGRKMDLLIESNQQTNESIQMLLQSLLSSQQGSNFSSHS